MITLTAKRLYVVWALLLILDVAVQIAMKLAGDQLYSVPFGLEWAEAAFWSRPVWFALTGYVATFFLWLAILHASPLSAAFPTTALVYVFVPLCGWLLLGEHIKPAQVAGIALILAGVWVQYDAKSPNRTG